MQVVQVLSRLRAGFLETELKLRRTLSNLPHMQPTDEQYVHGT